jgi:MoaA/NifB/PqqE/SkfB family radical SAM enzyme
MKLTIPEREARERLRLSKPLVYNKVRRYAEMLARGKSIATLDVQYSFLCNFHCVHCAVSNQREIVRECMTPADIKNLCDQADAYGLAHFCITGGEPLAFPDLKEVIEAIGPERFYIQIDTNGYLLTQLRADWLKALGVDKIQLSLDGLDAMEHDQFRRKQGSYVRVLNAINYSKNTGMSVQIATVVTHQSIGEFEKFLDFTDRFGAVVAVQTPKLEGEWEGHYDLLLTADDMAKIADMRKRHNVNTHLTPGWGMDIGCLAAKKILTINAWGDCMPCSGMRFSLGNIRETPLKDILAKGIRYFGAYNPMCRTGTDVEFNKQVLTKTYRDGAPLPIEDMLHGS